MIPTRQQHIDFARAAGVHDVVQRLEKMTDAEHRAWIEDAEEKHRTARR